MVTDTAYAELGLSPGATEAEVKAAWRRLASQWHPDRNPSAAASGRMQRINQALEHIRQSGFTIEASAKPETGAADDADADTQARTVSRRIRLTLEEAAAGCVKAVRGRLVDRCTACETTGWRVLGGACSACAGSGTVRQRAWYGWFGVPAECEACAGAGIARQVCEACAGTGKLPVREYRMHVRIPHGVRDGDLLHVGGRRPRAGHVAVHLELRVEIMPHALFKLSPDGTVHGEVPVDGFAWMANRRVDVPTLGGLHKLQLNREQLSYRLGGLGFPTERRGARGDHVVTVQPLFPDHLSADQEILLDQLVASNASAASPRLAEWQRALRNWKKAQPQPA